MTVEPALANWGNEAIMYGFCGYPTACHPSYAANQTRVLPEDTFAREPVERAHQETLLLKLVFDIFPDKDANSSM